MMNEEEYLNSKMGKKNPFTVPEGYFDKLTEQVMAKIPAEAEQVKPARTVQLRPWFYAAAACVCVAVFTAALLFSGRSENNVGLQQMASMEQENTNYYSDTYIDEEADYAMVDNQEIYAYLLANM
ncbi:MAG: hypothetical protein IJ243_09950 [Prevotella sp.]|nr:hypothetical protein [Prevotella sp.]